METTKTLRKYVTPSIGVLDIRIERGFGDSFPGGTTKNHSKKMKTSEFQRIQRFSFCFNCAKHADLGISIVPNSWLFFEPLKKATI